MDSEIGLPGKSRAEITRLSPIFAPKKWLWVITQRRLGPGTSWRGRSLDTAPILRLGFEREFRKNKKGSGGMPEHAAAPFFLLLSDES
jgi:hypothetical protein